MQGWTCNDLVSEYQQYQDVTAEKEGEMDEKDGVMEQKWNSVAWKHLSISIMQKSQFRNLHDANEYFKSESLEPTMWPILHTPCSEPEVTHLLTQLLSLCIYYCSVPPFNRITSKSPNPILTLLWFNIEFLFMWIKAISSQKLEKN